MTIGETSGDGRDHLFRDSKLGVLVVGAATVAFDALLDGAITTLTDVNTAGWNGWWTTVASAAIATGLGALTAYKAKRRAGRTAH